MEIKLKKRENFNEYLKDEWYSFGKIGSVDEMEQFVIELAGRFLNGVITKIEFGTDEAFHRIDPSLSIWNVKDFRRSFNEGMLSLCRLTFYGSTVSNSVRIRVPEQEIMVHCDKSAAESVSSVGYCFGWTYYIVENSLLIRESGGEDIEVLRGGEWVPDISSRRYLYDPGYDCRLISESRAEKIIEKWKKT